jgi:hypothetical protein
MNTLVDPWIISRHVHGQYDPYMGNMILSRRKREEVTVSGGSTIREGSWWGILHMESIHVKTRGPMGPTYRTL